MSKDLSSFTNSSSPTSLNRADKQQLWELYLDLRRIEPAFPCFWDISLAPFTTFATGGNAVLLLLPQTPEQVCRILQLCVAKQLHPSIMGGGANLLVADAGVSAPVLCLRGLRSLDWNPKSNCLTAGAGWDMSALCRFAAEHNAAGLQHFYGMPGSLGGAVYMNARCYEGEMAEVVQRVLCIPQYALQALSHVEGPALSDSLAFNSLAPSSSVLLQARWVDFNLHDWHYKYSHFQRDSGHELAAAVILAVQLQLGEQGSAALQREMQSFLEDRIVKGHFRLPCAGSFFKNNRSFGAPTGQIIDGLGLKGLRCGAAQLAPWHGNIIVNSGSAKSGEIWELACRIRKHVYRHKGWILEAEVQRLGAWPPDDLDLD